jgi:transposase
MRKSIRNLSAVTTIGLDIAKNVFQVHGVDAAGVVVVAKSIRRAQLLAFFASLPSCLVGIEACSSAHHWARALIAMGHRVKLMPPAYVKPYVRRNKNDAVDAEAICEAVGRPNMRFVAVRAVENQAELMRHRTRELLAGNRTRMLNALRGHLAEIGVVAPQGAQHAYGLKRLLTAGHDENGEIVVPDCVREALAPLAQQIDAIDDALNRASVRSSSAPVRRLKPTTSAARIAASFLVSAMKLISDDPVQSKGPTESPDYSGNPSRRAPSISLSTSVDAPPIAEYMPIRVNGTISMPRRAIGAASSKRPANASASA